MLDLSVRGNSAGEINAKHALIANALRDEGHCYVTTVTSPTTASQPFKISHTLAKLPVWVMGTDDTGTANLGVADEDYRLWTDKYIVVRSPFASVKYRVLIVAVG